MRFVERLQHAWNVFTNRAGPDVIYNTGVSYSTRPDRTRFHIGGNERSIVAAIYTRIAIDVSQITFQHVRIDENGRFKEEINSGLNRCLNLNANIDQTGREFILDLIVSLLDEGCVAVVPTDANIDIENDSFKVSELRVGKITQWWPDRVRVNLYNEKSGLKQDVIVLKKSVAIIENPLYAVMNEPNSTLRRLIRKLNLLDAIDDQSGSGKLDIIIQLPYTVRTDLKRRQAEKRVKDIEMQLSGSKYGIAYADATEHITQLNRPVENNLMTQITYLTTTLYGQLGLTEDVMNGKASETEQLNYHNRTIEPLCSAIVNAFRWKFLTETARSQGQSIMFFRDPFKLVPAQQMAEIADKLTRNEILTSNELRAIIGYRPVDDPKADKLVNSNLNQKEEAGQSEEQQSGDVSDNQNGSSAARDFVRRNLDA